MPVQIIQSMHMLKYIDQHKFIISIRTISCTFLSVVPIHAFYANYSACVCVSMDNDNKVDGLGIIFVQLLIKALTSRGPEQ
jgi:hypothetical protein